MKRAGDDKRLSKVVSTKVTDKDYELCQRIARDYYIKGNILRTPSVSELARLALELIFSTRRPSPIVDNLLKSQPRLTPHCSMLCIPIMLIMMMNLQPCQGPKEEEDITIKEIKKAVEKAIEILLRKLDPNDN